MSYIGSTPVLLTVQLKLDQLIDVSDSAKSNNDIIVYSSDNNRWEYQNLDTNIVPEGNTNLYYTDERVDDRVAALLQAGANITINYDDANNVITISGVEDNLSNNTTDDLAEGNTNLYYTDSRVSLFLGVVDTNIVPAANVTYDIGTPTSRFRDIYLSGNTISLGDATITASGNGIVLPAGSTVFGAGTLLDANTSTTDDLNEGAANLYYTTLRANTDIDARVTKTFVDNLGVDAATLEGANGSYYLDWTNVTNKPDPNIEVTLSGDVTGSANLTMTDLAGGTISITTTIEANSVALGTDTTGDYVSTITGGTGVTVTGGTGESSTPSIAIGQNVSTSANVTFQNGTFTGDLQIDGDFTVTGNVVTINVQELSVKDNLIYLNANSDVTNPDLGWAGAYNDGTYAHAGFFRDATDGMFKAFDSYTPEPDESAFIDTSHPSFSLASIQTDNLKANSIDINGYGAVITANGEWVGDPDTVRGYTGSRGFTGSQGVIGYTGSQGVIGYTGSRGFTGSQGDIGYTGSAGTAGDIGYTGSQGIQGDIGYTGSAGTAGATGFTGSIGYTGSAGPSTTINATDVTDNDTVYPVFVTAAGSNQTAEVTTGKLYFNPSTGQLNATEFNSLSDEAMKDNIVKISNALEIIKNLDGIQFNWKDNNKLSYGLSAQEVEKVIPALVSTNDHKSVNYNGIIAFLIEAIKALNEKIENK